MIIYIDHNIQYISQEKMFLHPLSNKQSNISKINKKTSLNFKNLISFIFFLKNQNSGYTQTTTIPMIETCNVSK